MKMKYGLKQIMTETPLEVRVEKGQGAYHVSISEKMKSYSMDDLFYKAISGAALKRDAVKLQNEIFDYMMEQGFTRVSKVYWDGK